MSEHYEVCRDGKVLKQFDNEVKAFGYLLSIQGNSVSHACKYEGFEIKVVKGNE